MSEVDKKLSSEGEDAARPDAAVAADEKGDDKRADSRADQSEEMPVWADALMKRMDALEADKTFPGGAADAARADETKDEDKPKAEAKAETKADSKRADADEDKAKESREDAKAYADAAIKSNRAMEAKLAALEAQLARATKPLSYEDKNALGAARAYADGVYQRFGEHAPEPLPGEGPIAYRKRLATGMQRYSNKFAKESLDALSGSVFDTVEASIYADAITASKDTSDIADDRLIAVTSDRSGLRFTEYHGSPNAWMKPFKARGHVIKFNTAASRE